MSEMETDLLHPKPLDPLWELVKCVSTQKQFEGFLICFYGN